MIVEIITTGTELLLGEITNTNSVYLSKRLNEHGFDVLYQTTIGDNRNRMYNIIKTALQRADIIITSGGLGPTQGDITKEICAKIMNENLVFDETISTSIKKRFKVLNKEMTENNLRQAYVPENAKIFYNTVGTAAGICMEKNNKLIINLPGPPRELKPMFENSVLPYLAKRYPTNSIIMSRILNTYGIGESSLEEILIEDIKNQKNPTLALLVRPYGIIVRTTAKATNKRAANNLLNKMETHLRQKIDKYIYGIDNILLEDVIIRALLSKNLTISCAESCSGGLLTNRLTDIHNSSKILKGSVISCNSEILANEVSINPILLKNYTEPNKKEAELLALNIRQKYHVDIGIGITGNIEPNLNLLSSSTVFISISGKYGTIVSKNTFTGNHKEIKYYATQTALNTLRHYIKKYV